VFLQVVGDALAFGFQHVARKAHSRHQQAAELDHAQLVFDVGRVDFGANAAQSGGLTADHVEAQFGSLRAFGAVVVDFGKKVAFLAELAFELSYGFGRQRGVENRGGLANLLKPLALAGFGFARPALVEGHVGVGAQDRRIGLELQQFEVLVVGSDLAVLGKFDASNPGLPLGQPSLGVAGGRHGHQKKYACLTPH